MRWRVGSVRFWPGDEGILLRHLGTYIGGQVIHCLLSFLKLPVLHYHSIMGFLKMHSHRMSKIRTIASVVIR